MIIGYARKSTVGQSLRTQVKLLTEYGCDEIIQEAVSGVSKEKELYEIVEEAEPNTTVVVTRVDRLGRSAIQIMSSFQRMKERNVNLIILDLGVDTRTPAGELVLNVMASVAQYERDILKDKQKKGIAAAKAAGKHLGRQAGYSKEALQEAIARYERGGLTYADVERLYKIPHNSFYKALKKHRQNLVLEAIK